jgi:hypothetical protein
MICLGTRKIPFMPGSTAQLLEDATGGFPGTRKIFIETKDARFKKVISHQNIGVIPNDAIHPHPRTESIISPLIIPQ